MTWPQFFSRCNVAVRLQAYGSEGVESNLHRTVTNDTIHDLQRLTVLYRRRRPGNAVLVLDYQGVKTRFMREP